MENKFEIDFKNGCANYNYVTKNGNKKISRFLIFTDFKGLKIFTSKGIVYLTEQNSIVL